MELLTYFMAVKFTQEQVREVLDLSPETIRHWRKVLPPLAERPRGQLLSYGDILALAAIKSFVHQMGVPSSSLGPPANDIFQICSKSAWPALAQCRLELSEGNAQLVESRASLRVSQNPILIVHLGPLIAKLSQQLFGGATLQPELKFPLAAVRSHRR